jgi:hypothetical protein
MDAGPPAYLAWEPRAVSLSAPARKLLARESRYLVWGLLFGLVSVPSIGTVYYREDIAIGYRQFLGGLFDREIWFIAVAYLLVPYLLVQLVRSTLWAWRRTHRLAKEARGASAPH